MSTLLETYLAERAGLRRLLKARLGREDEADDLLQEMFVRLSQSGPAEPPANPAGYLYRAALNLARDHQRERQRTRARDGHWAQATQLRSGTEAVAEFTPADVAYDAKQRLALLIAALGGLSEQPRRVFVLHKFEGLTHPQIGARLGISRSTVEKHMTTALKHLIATVGGA